MKLFVSIDMEGITGIPDYTFIDSSKHNYERARRIITQEGNAIVECAISSCVKEILVNDSHSKMNSILVEELHPEASLMTGEVKSFSMVQSLKESYIGAVFAGLSLKRPVLCYVFSLYKYEKDISMML